MSATQYRLIELAIVPRAAKLPSDLIKLITIEALTGYCPMPVSAKIAREFHLGQLIDSTLTEAGR